MAFTGGKQHQVGSFLQERWRVTMGGRRFKPENFHEISRVLGERFAPDLNRVVSKHRADAASAYLRRLQRDVERSQEGYYGQLQGMPLQIRRLQVRKEDPRSFKSVLVPKLKLSPLSASADTTTTTATSSPRTVKSQSPKVVSPDGGAQVLPLVTTTTTDGTSYVPHKSFSPHSHTHIHVLFKQTPRKSAHKKGSGGPSSVVSGTETSVGGASNSSVITTADSKAFKAKQNTLKNGLKLPSPREEDDSLSHEVQDDGGEDSAPWPAVENAHLPYTLPKLPANNGPAPLPNIKKRLVGDKTPRGVAKSVREVHSNNHSNSTTTTTMRTAFRSPRSEQQSSALPSASKPEVPSPVNRMFPTTTTRAEDPQVQEALPPNVAAALAAGSSISALYNLGLPHKLASAYDKNLPTVAARPKAVMLGGKGSRLPLPSIPPANVSVGDEMLAITSVQRSNAIQLAG
ncbi:uncharacterized protein LOC143299650 [Babylonia areolata]|uniref:uncharacterized protein LOC143299650 n=1 Tax=Babylonia areolata TaxID=304850 RepID=UPI003FD4E6F8